MNKQLQQIESKIDSLLKELTLKEKIGMVHGSELFSTRGVERLSIPPLKMSDGPMGVRNDFEHDNWKTIGYNNDYVTYLPSQSAVAATFQRELSYLNGQVLGEETRGRGKDIILAPGVNIKRSPLCGRNFEYFSEDPYLAGEMAVPMIRGIQEQDVSACVKHFAANNQETERLFVDTLIDKRALFEIYLPAFYKAVKEAGSYSIMGAYNLLNGEHCCQSKYLLNQVLRKDWEYDGVVISDWGAVHNTKLAAEGGLDIEMSVTNNFDEYFMANPLLEAIENETIDESFLDTKVKNILRLMFRLHMFEDNRKKGIYNTPEHRDTVLKISRESVVLLKNQDNVLPLSPPKLKKLLIIGENADRIHSNGGGSAEIKALYEISPLMGLSMLLGGNTEITYAKGYCSDKKLASDINWQATSLEDCSKSGTEQATEQKMKEERQKLAEEAIHLAAEFDNVIFIGGLNHDYDLEGQDRSDMKLPYGQDELIQKLLLANPNTIIVITAGSPVEMQCWKENAKAIIWNWYAGMEGGKALAEVLLGITNPSGKLPETFPKNHNDCAAHCIGEFAKTDFVEYKESIYTGYRYYDTFHIETEFCFGHGLSYTEFKYSDLEINGFIVSCNITNTGEQEGKEAVQLYIRKPNSNIKRAFQELKGFEKTVLAVGESKRVVFKLDKSSFHYYDENTNEFKAELGYYEICIGSSSKDIRLTGMLEIQS